MALPKVVVSYKVSLPSGETVEFGLIETKDLKVSEFNPRKLHTNIDIADIAKDMKNRGQLSPLLLDEKYEVLGGQRRLFALFKAEIPTALYIKRDYTKLAELDLPVIRAVKDFAERVETLKRKDAFSDNEFLLPLEAMDKEAAVSEMMRIAGIDTLEAASDLFSRSPSRMAGWTRGKLGLDEGPPASVRKTNVVRRRTRVPVRKIIEARTVTAEQKREYTEELKPLEKFEKRVNKEVEKRLKDLRPDLELDGDFVEFRITLPVSLHTRLVAEAERSEIDISDIIKYALEKYLPRPTTKADVVSKLDDIKEGQPLTISTEEVTH